MGNPTDEPVSIAPDYAALHEAQGAMCKAKGWPWFAPRVCWHCHREVYSHPHTQSTAGAAHVTGCPHCHASYCD